MNDRTHHRHSTERGAASIEYALLASLIALSIIVGASAIGVSLGGTLSGLANAF